MSFRLALAIAACAACCLLLVPRLAAACAFVAAYAIYAVVLRLLPADELAEITRIFSGR